MLEKVRISFTNPVVDGGRGWVAGVEFYEPYRLIGSNSKCLFLVIFVYLSFPKSAKPK